MEYNEINPAADQGAQQQVSSTKSKQPVTEKAALAYLHDLVYLLAGIMLLLLLLFRVVVVSGTSMTDTLLNGDYLLLLNNMFCGEFEHGDIIVASKDTFKDGEPIIKRVIATENQTVDIDFEAGIVYVDGVALEEDYTLTPTNYQEGMQFPLTVEEGCVFVMGDNRNGSRDSRDPQIGLIDTREILGKAVLLMFPGTYTGSTQRDFSRIGVVD